MTTLLRSLAFAVLLAVAMSPGGGAPAAWAADPIHIGLSAPLTGNFAEYGQLFQKAIDLAVEGINASGGVKGRPLVIVVGDSRADPKEAAALAQKFTSDPRIVAEIGDFSSTACTRVKIAVVAPMPRASVRTAVAVNPGAFVNCRNA